MLNQNNWSWILAIAVVFMLSIGQMRRSYSLKKRKKNKEEPSVQDSSSPSNDTDFKF